MRRRAIACTAVHHQGFSTHASHGTCHVDSCVAAAVNGHAATEHRLFILGNVLENAHGVQDARGVARWDIGASSQMCTHAQEHSVVLAFLHFLCKIGHFAAVFNRHPRAHNALDFRIEYFTGQTILRNTVAHHAAAGLCTFDHVYGVAGLAQMVSRAQAGGTGAHHEHALAGFLLRLGQIPTLGKRIVA